MLKIKQTEPWTQPVVAGVNARLYAFFDEKSAQADKLSPRAQELVAAVAELTMRGGKRLRPLLIYAGFRATAGQVTANDWDAIATLGASIELLQSYLLIQDDWMDGDAERRGGPATHAAFARQYQAPKLGASLAILAGDIALGFAVELLHATQFPARRAADALGAFVNMHFEVVCGQQLDLLAHPDVPLMQHLKTGSYTVRGPVALGALLADANDEQLHALERYSTPLGLAFQLRDDLLGTFGESRVTGKPVGHDLRAGKLTALVSEARRLLAAPDRLQLDRVFGNPQASADELAEATRTLERSGVRARVEGELASRLADSRQALRDGTCLQPMGTDYLLELLERISARDH